MPNFTEHLNLEKPLPNERYNIVIQNLNMDKIDTEIKKLTEDIKKLTEELDNFKTEISNAISGKLDKTGGTVTGHLTVTGNVLSNNDITALLGG